MLTLKPTTESKKVVGDDTTLTLGLNLESCSNQVSKFGKLSRSALNLVIIRLLTDSQLQQKEKNLKTDSKKFVGDDTRSQFGELSKSALQIWKVPNQLSKSGYYQTPKRVQADSQQTPDRHTSNLKTVS